MRWMFLCFLLSGCGSSCTEQGGKLIQDGYFYVWQPIDAAKGTGYMQAYPNFICIKENT
jgi:hypothetical protein